ncbi:hypothetical protein EDL79_01270 [Ehrlichia ruminantium]|uniref:Uncharacterized protein n=1 Tax=Ehrlichia ruminantium TaxID=779 RepID=A0AAE6QAY4_EHRRU|nr:hypothetical protein [Ehrlichia ruminantium]QGR03231.1 hypothetical protein EDL80_01270 [Ehrlichia ruminantium]QGR04156.1 hypothetical protein EDL79_01270 [Ehrlichia ruminantium]
MNNITNITIATIIVSTIIITLSVILFYTLLSLANQNIRYKFSIATFKAYLNTLSKNDIKKILSQKSKYIIETNTGTNLLNLNILINGVDFTTLEKKSQRHYQDNDYIKLLHSIKNKHIHYLSQLLDTTPNVQELYKYTDEINLATSLDAVFSIFCTVISDKFVPPTPSITHELVIQLCKTGYEMLGYSILMNTLKDSQTYNITITDKKTEFLLTNTPNKLGVRVLTDILIYNRINPNIRYNISTTCSFYILQQNQTYNSHISYTNMYFTLSFPQHMKRYINIEGYDIVQNLIESAQENHNYPILIFSEQNHHNQYIMQYKIPSPITVQLPTIQEHTTTKNRTSTQNNTSPTTKTIPQEQQRQVLHLQVEKDGISHFIRNSSHKKK